MHALAMHPIHWLFTHPSEAQIINILVTIFLTLALIVITYRYTKITSRSVRILEADVRARLKPIPHVGLEFTGPLREADNNTQRLMIIIRTENAPLRIVNLRLFFDGTYTHTSHSETFHQRIVTVETAFAGECQVESMPRGLKIWQATLRYQDLSGLLIYTTHFREKGFVGEERPIDPHTTYNRLRRLGNRISNIF
jgi:hypothetical protein